MKRNIFYLILAALAAGFTACQKDLIPEQTLISDEKAEVIAYYSSAEITWYITTDATITNARIEYSSDSTFAEFNSWYMDAVEGYSGSEKQNIAYIRRGTVTDLTRLTTYYFRLRAENHSSSYVSKIYSFKTTDFGPPAIQTDSVTNITTISADLNATLLDRGSEDTPKVGFCIARHPDVSVKDSTCFTVYVKDITNNRIKQSLTGLLDSTTYYVRAFAENQKGLSYGNEVAFRTGKGQLATIQDPIAGDVGYTYAVIQYVIKSNNNNRIMEHGVCYSTSENPTIADHKVAAEGDNVVSGTFTVFLENLKDNTTYYIRAYASHQSGTAYSGQIQITTKELTTPVIETVISDVGCTTAVCGGTFTDLGGSELTEWGVCYSTNPCPTLTDNKVIAKESKDGKFECELTGLTLNNTYYVRAFATNQKGTGYGKEMKFITGTFFVSDSLQVYFSKGNLQYNAMFGTHICADGSLKPGTWRFATEQYDIIGKDNQNIASDYDGWIDLFAWGTSGWSSGADQYQPWATDGNDASYYPGGAYGYENNLTGNFANADWGVYNAISNGGNTPGQWRTLTWEEWNYLFNKRKNAKDLCGAATVNGITGYMLLPNGFNIPKGLIFVAQGKCTNNVYTENQWKDMQDQGAIFLPAAGTRQGTDVSDGVVGERGYYWSASASKNNSSNYYATYVYFYPLDNGSISTGTTRRYFGNSVRLVQDIK